VEDELDVPELVPELELFDELEAVELMPVEELELTEELEAVELLDPVPELELVTVLELLDELERVLDDEVLLVDPMLPSPEELAVATVPVELLEVAVDMDARPLLVAAADAVVLLEFELDADRCFWLGLSTTSQPASATKNAAKRRRIRSARPRQLRHRHPRWARRQTTGTSRRRRWPRTRPIGHP
jgi:hypothetical protein